MAHLGWRDPSTGEEQPFDHWLARAEADGQALGFPYEVLHGIYTQNKGEHRPSGISATMLLRCPRRVMLEKLTDFYTEASGDYAAFRGVIGHSMLEANKVRDSLVEQRYWRMHKGIALSGQLDKWRFTNVPAGIDGLELAEQYDEWLQAIFIWEKQSAEGLPVGDAPARPKLPRTIRLEIEDWKTKDKLPEYQYVAKHYQEQGNLYRWLMRWDKDKVDVKFVFVSMTGVKVQPLYNGGNYANGRAKPEQIWDDEAVEDFLDKRLLVLAASEKVGRPLPYAKVSTDDLWECNWCPIRLQCYAHAAGEAQAAWAKGESVERIAPRVKADEEKAAKANASKRGRKTIA